MKNNIQEGEQIKNWKATQRVTSTIYKHILGGVLGFKTKSPQQSLLYSSAEGCCNVWRELPYPLTGSYMPQTTPQSPLLFEGWGEPDILLIIISQIYELECHNLSVFYCFVFCFCLFI